MSKIRAWWAVAAGKRRRGHPRLRLGHGSTRRKVRRILKQARREHPPVEIDARELAAHRELWGEFQPAVDDAFYLLHALITGEQSRYLVPEDIFYAVIEPALNDVRSSSALVNKGLYDRVWSKELFPRVLLRNVSGFDYDEHFRRVGAHRWKELVAAEKILVVKPSLRSGGGRNVRIFRRQEQALRDREGNVLDRELLSRLYRDEFVVQEYVDQHEYLAALNPSSVNTVRMLTYRSVKDDAITILHSAMRIGRAGSEVDNESAGGVSCGIDADGRPTPIGSELAGRRHECAPSGLRFADLPPIPAYDELARTAIRTAQPLVDHRLVAVDLTLDREARPRVLELNLRDVALSLHQRNGGPLFGPYLDEVLEHCRQYL